MDDTKTEHLKELPGYIRILGKKFKIKSLKENEFPEADGIMDLSGQIIGIREQSGKDYMKDTLLHETIHAVEESLGLRMTEKQVHQLACGLLAVLKDNPEFTKWLTQDD